MVPGVLLLNAVLTVEASKANSHKDKGWEKLTDAVITWISKNLTSVVFLLWGSYAQKKASIVDKVSVQLISYYMSYKRFMIRSMFRIVITY